MLDWPEASHTSPTRMSVSLTVFFPAKVSVASCSDAGIAGRSTRQRPSEPVTTVAVREIVPV